MRAFYLVGTIVLIAAVLVTGMAGNAILVNRARFCAHAAAANAVAVAFDWNAWQEQGVYRFAHPQEAYNEAAATITPCLNRLAPNWEQVWLELNNSAPRPLAPTDRVWGVTAADYAPAPWLAVCVSLRGYPPFRGGLTCAVISAVPGVLEP